MDLNCRRVPLQKITNANSQQAKEFNTDVEGFSQKSA
jgi:hypothetical protein